MNLRSFGDRLVWVPILVRKRLDLRPVLEVHFGSNGIGYLDIKEQPINLYIRCCHRITILNIEFEAIWTSFGLGFNSGT